MMPDQASAKYIYVASPDIARNSPTLSRDPLGLPPQDTGYIKEQIPNNQAIVPTFLTPSLRFE